MKIRPFKLLLLVILGATLAAQSVERRLLTWSDFKGVPDVASRHDAYTYWSVRFSYDSPQAEADGIKLKVRVWNSLDARSWVKQEAIGKIYQSDLLEHEQGHYNLSVICALEFKKAVSIFKFTENYHDEVSRIFSETLERTRKMELDYDNETQHMRERRKQKLWNMKINKTIEDLLSYQ